jgi:hypothetical protein
VIITEADVFYNHGRTSKCFLKQITVYFAVSEQRAKSVPEKYVNKEGMYRKEMYYFALATFDACDEVMMALKRFNTAGTVRD